MNIRHLKHNLPIKRYLILVGIVLVSACQPLAVNSFTSTPSGIVVSPTLYATNTFTSAPIETPTPSETFTPLPPQPFNPASIPTFTLSSPAQCPKEDADLVFDAKRATDFSGSNLNQPQRHEQYVKNILNYINSGGTLKSVVSGFSKQYSYNFDKIIYVQDVTGDNVPELISPFDIWMDIFGCEEGNYSLLLSATYESDLGGVSIMEVSDVNIDGLAEVVVYFDGCLGGKCPTIRVYEWNGKEFKDLIENYCNSLSTPFEIKIQDIDNNGTKEMIFQNEGDRIPDGIYGFPYRKKTKICMWNGKSFDIYKDSFGAPYYRFQAVQDGDVETLAGDYQKAMEFYQQSISGKTLEWFTQERNLYEYWVYMAKLFPPQPTPIVPPDMKPDPNEYPNLAAYSQYRIMLLYVLQNNISDAEVKFNTLQNEYPFDKPGGYFAKMAFTFWQEYQISQNIQEACRITIAYASEDTGPLKYLGDSEHGTQRMEYTPEAICPFK